MIIDCHVHLFQDRVIEDRSPFVASDKAFGALYSSPKSRIATPIQIIEYLDNNSISKAVVFGFPWKQRDLFRENNDAVLEFSSKYPDRIIPFATFGLSDPDEAYFEAEKTLKSGFKGLGELSMYETGWDKSSLSTLKASVQIAAKAEAAVMLHVNEPVGHYYPGKIYTSFDGLLELIAEFPKVDFILAHFGGGIFFYALMPEIRNILTNTYVDTAASPFIYDPAIYEIALKILGENNILFGSDFPLLGFQRYAREVDNLSLTASQKDKIFGQNALQLFNSKLLQR